MLPVYTWMYNMKNQQNHHQLIDFTTKPETPYVIWQEITNVVKIGIGTIIAWKALATTESHVF